MKNEREKTYLVLVEFLSLVLFFLFFFNYHESYVHQLPKDVNVKS